MIQNILTMAVVVYLVAFSTFNAARCFGYGRVAIGCVFVLMALMGVCWGRITWKEMKEERKERHV